MIELAAQEISKRAMESNLYKMAKSIPNLDTNMQNLDRAMAKDLAENGENRPLREESFRIDSTEVVGQNIEARNPMLNKIEASLGTSEGITALIEKHPEKAELWKGALEAIELLENPEASPLEIQSAQGKLSMLKGQLLETAVKDVLADVGFDVEPRQKLLEGETGGTRPDVIAINNTDAPLEAFGIKIVPGETISIECKCGSSMYMTNQLEKHIPNQLSGQIGQKILLATSDINNTKVGLVQDVCATYGAQLVVPNVSVADVEKAIKGVVSK